MAQAATSEPRLESCDRLSRDEFHRRYELRPDIRRAELIDGIVYVASPTSHQHAGPHHIVVAWTGKYFDVSPLALDAADNGTWRLANSDDEVQPDVALWRTDSGLASYDDDGYMSGSPDLVIEVSYSSVQYDMVTKKRAYERAGVAEYVVWDVGANALHWFRLRDGKYEDVQPDAEGIMESAVFPGLCVDVTKLAEAPRHAFFVRA